MVRRLTFADTHKLYFRLLYEAFRTRGSAPQDARVSTDEKKTDAKLLKALKAISDPVGEPPADGIPDVRGRVLKPGGGAIDLEQKPEFARLVGFVESCQWAAVVSDVADDLESWLDAAEKVG